MTQKTIVLSYLQRKVFDQLQKQDKIPSIANIKLCLDFKQAAGKHLCEKKQLILSKSFAIYYGMLTHQGPEDPSCVCILADGSYYEGQAKRGQFNGQGKLKKFETGVVAYCYEGQWKDGAPNGKGSETILNTSVFQGEFRHGLKDGFGVLRFADGSIFEGQFKDNAIHGSGTYKTQYHKWTGEWIDGYLEGKGEQVIFDGSRAAHNSVYKGEFKRGEKQGLGLFKWGKHKCVYEGEFLKGQLNGEGKLKLGQSEFTGIWQKGLQLNLKKKNSSSIRLTKGSSKNVQKTGLQK